jgi:hypothetical protein
MDSASVLRIKAAATGGPKPAGTSRSGPQARYAAPNPTRRANAHAPLTAAGSNVTRRDTRRPFAVDHGQAGGRCQRFLMLAHDKAVTP